MTDGVDNDEKLVKKHFDPMLWKQWRVTIRFPAASDVIALSRTFDARSAAETWLNAQGIKGPDGKVRVRFAEVAPGHRVIRQVAGDGSGSVWAASLWALVDRRPAEKWTWTPETEEEP